LSDELANLGRDGREEKRGTEKKEGVWCRESEKEKRIKGTQ
jgi:hypothetical protein